MIRGAVTSLPLLLFSELMKLNVLYATAHLKATLMIHAGKWEKKRFCLNQNTQLFSLLLSYLLSLAFSFFAPLLSLSCSFNFICLFLTAIFSTSFPPLFSFHSHFSCLSLQFLRSTLSSSFILTPSNIFLSQLNLSFAILFLGACLCVSVSLVNSLLHEANLVSTKMHHVPLAPLNCCCVINEWGAGKSLLISLSHSAGISSDALATALRHKHTGDN